MAHKHIAGSAWGPASPGLGTASGIHEPAQEWRPQLKWQPTPRYHINRLFGYVWRRMLLPEGGWQYQTNKQRAKQILEEQFNASQQPSDNGAQRASGIGGRAGQSFNATRRG